MNFDIDMLHWVLDKHIIYESCEYEWTCQIDMYLVSMTLSMNNNIQNTSVHDGLYFL
jgi:hypothetical protein